MSCTLYWKPVTKLSHTAGDIQLRNILEKKYGYPSRLDHSDLTYLEGLSDSEVEGVDKLIDAINTYDEIEIYKEC